MGSKSILHGWVIDSQDEKNFDSHWEGYFISYSWSISVYYLGMFWCLLYSYAIFVSYISADVRQDIVFINCFITNQIGCLASSCWEWSKIWLNNSWHCFHSFDIQLSMKTGLTITSKGPKKLYYGRGVHEPSQKAFKVWDEKAPASSL